MVLSKKEALANHRRMWRRIAERTRAEKRCVDDMEVLEEIWGDVQILNDCWCCEYCGCRCNECPVVWGGNETYWCIDAEYYNWQGAVYGNNWKHTAEIADRIAELPERKNARRR